jgi:hypothetical protein
VQSKKMPHAQPALHLRRAQQFVEAGCRMRLEDASQTFMAWDVIPFHRHSWHARAVLFLLAKGEFDSGGHESARELIEKIPHRVVFRIGLIVERWARTCFVRHPRSDINLS